MNSNYSFDLIFSLSENSLTFVPLLSYPSSVQIQTLSFEYPTVKITQTTRKSFYNTLYAIYNVKVEKNHQTVTQTRKKKKSSSHPHKPYTKQYYICVHARLLARKNNIKLPYATQRHFHRKKKLVKARERERRKALIRICGSIVTHTNILDIEYSCLSCVYHTSRDYESTRAYSVHVAMFNPCVSGATLGPFSPFFPHC